MNSTKNIQGKQNSAYIIISEKDLPAIFEIVGDTIYLKDSKALPFKINFPLYLNEELAKIAAMILDGSVSKNLMRCSFAQKKDKSKVTEFSNIIKRRFSINDSFSIHKGSGTHEISYSRKAFVSFLYHCLNIHKSDEKARIPYWIWKSPRSVIIEYLRYAFAMEGSVSSYLRANEVKFHSTDLQYMRDLKNLLKNKFDITSKIHKYYIKGYGWKYFLYFQDKENIIKFMEIGFALQSHQQRLEEIVGSFKNKAWEITLVEIFNLDKNAFNASELKRIFPYIGTWTIYQRLRKLINKRFLMKEKRKYYLTDQGYKVALSLKDKVKNTSLRTNPKKNEERIIKFLDLKGKSYRNEIARELKIKPPTIRDTLRRLIQQNKIEVADVDKFKRKFYRIKNPTTILDHNKL